MNPTPERQEEIRYWWSQARDSLESAGKEVRFGAYFFALNRVYYAVFYGVSAVLLGSGVTPTGHQAIREAFKSQFIDPGLLDPEYLTFYDELLRDIMERDSGTLHRFDRPNLEARINAAARLLDTLNTHLPATSS